MAAFQMLGILRRAWRIFYDQDMLLQCFRSFVLPLLEYCSPVWGSSAECNVRLLDRVVKLAPIMLIGDLQCNL